MYVYADTRVLLNTLHKLFFIFSGFLSAKVVSSRASSSSGSLQRSRSDVDVNAAASAKSRMPAVAATAPFSSAAALPPGSYASLGKTTHTYMFRAVENSNQSKYWCRELIMRWLCEIKGPIFVCVCVFSINVL